MAEQNDIGQRQREAEALVHMSYGRAYGRALEMQADRSSPEARKAAAAQLVAERASTAARDPSSISHREAQAGRATMEAAYGRRAADVSAVLSGRVVDYDLPRGVGGTKDMSALASKAQVLVSKANVEAFAARGVVNVAGPAGNYMERIGGKAAESREQLTTHMLHVKSAIESAVDRKELDRRQGDSLYHRFQNAAFDRGDTPSKNPDYTAFDKANTPRLRQDVARDVESRYAAQAATIDRARSRELDPGNMSRAEAFRKDSPETAVTKHPELAGAYGSLAAVAKQVQATGMNAQQQALILAKARENVAASIERGHIPEIKTRESRDVNHNRDAGAER